MEPQIQKGRSDVIRIVEALVTNPAIPNLEFSADEMRRMADAVVARSIEHVASLRTQPVLGDALLCARERYLGADIRSGVIYTSDQAHHSVIKAAKIAGVRPDRVRVLPCDERYRLPVSSLVEAIADDRQAGACACSASAR